MTARGWFLFSLMGVIWGIPYLMIKVAVDEVSPSTVVFARCAVGALLLLPLAIRQGGLFLTLRTHWRPMLAFACIEIMGPWFTLTDAERHLSSSTAGLLIAGVPIVGVVAAHYFGGEREHLGVRRIAGLLIGLAGVAVLTIPHLTGGDARSLGEVLLTVVGYATAPLIAARRLKDVPTLQLIAPCLTLAALVYAPAAAATWPTAMPSTNALLSLLALGVLCTALAFVAFLELIKEIGPTRSTVITYVNPAVAVAAGALFLGESFTATIAVSFALILTGSVLATLASAPRTAAEPVPTGPEGRAATRRLFRRAGPDPRPERGEARAR
ncbi:DMT family transporter [Streptomyces sp. NPDC006654]|uniref:DMT family transporter n=1 Tax=Streptomyces sp. NPDC006654 TaxID=3156897 RepID=UPI0033DF6DC5